MRTIRVAAAQYPIERLPSIDAYEARLADWVTGGGAEGADLLVFPAFAAFELAALAADPADPSAAVEAVHHALPEIDALLVTLSRRHGVHILAASAPMRGGDGTLRDVARLFTPAGPVGSQERIVTTATEQRLWGLAGGGPIAVFRTELGLIGVCIGYDVEFPLIARAAVEAGAEILLAPGAAPSPQAAARARHAAAARAVESQAFVVQAVTIGAAPWLPVLAASHGVAAVHAPPDGDFPADGLLAAGAAGAPGWVRASLDLDAIAALADGGGAGNRRDWPAQGVVTAPAAEIVDLTLSS